MTSLNSSFSTLEVFESLARSRRSTRHFKPDPLPPGLLERLLDAARWAPSGYNLQPTHFFVVEDPVVKQRLRVASMDQKQVTEAPAVVVFVGDRNVSESHFEDVIKAERDARAINDQYEAVLRKFVPISFGAGPLGLGRLAKALLLPVMRLFTPVPALPVVEKTTWLAKQASLTAMNFMLAAQAAGLSTVPMEGFDECRVKKVLGLSSQFSVLLIIPVGYAATEPGPKTRLPLSRLVHYVKA